MVYLIMFWNDLTKHSVDMIFHFGEICFKQANLIFPPFYVLFVFVDFSDSRFIVALSSPDVFLHCRMQNMKFTIDKHTHCKQQITSVVHQDWETHWEDVFFCRGYLGMNPDKWKVDNLCITIFHWGHSNQYNWATIFYIYIYVSIIHISYIHHVQNRCLVPAPAQWWLIS